MGLRLFRPAYGIYLLLCYICQQIASLTVLTKISSGVHMLYPSLVSRVLLVVFFFKFYQLKKNMSNYFTIKQVNNAK